MQIAKSPHVADKANRPSPQGLHQGLLSSQPGPRPRHSLLQHSVHGCVYFCARARARASARVHSRDINSGRYLRTSCCREERLASAEKRTGNSPRSHGIGGFKPMSKLPSVTCWSAAGQLQINCWSYTNDQKLINCWSTAGLLVKCCSNASEMLVKSWSKANQKLIKS